MNRENAKTLTNTRVVVCACQVTTTEAKQMELDRIAEDFKLLHNERKDLVRQWQESIEAMKKRDVEINEIGG